MHGACYFASCGGQLYIINKFHTVVLLHLNSRHNTKNNEHNDLAVLYFKML